MAITAGVDMAAVKRIRLRQLLIALAMLLGAAGIAAPASARVSVEIAIPGASIGVVQPVYPDLVLVPGYPVYYAPQLRVNYFFHDGFYWVFHEDRWYTSAWFDGPWDIVDPYAVPLFVLRVPVRYYVNPPRYFHGWLLAAPPRWDLHWGPRWAQHRHGWNQWDHRAVPRAAPPPLYQRHYSGDRYPRREYQRELHDHHYRYQQREANLQRQPAERPVSQHQSRAPARTQADSATPDRHEAPRTHSPQQERHEVRRYEGASVASRQQESVGREQRQPARPEPERRAQFTPAPDNTPVTRQSHEQMQRPAPLHSSTPPRPQQSFEHRPAVRADPGPREPQFRQAPQNRERNRQAASPDQSRGHPERGRGH